MIKGTVKDKTTGEGLYLANVYFSDSEGKPVIFNNTSIGGAADFDGNFKIDSLITAKYVSASMVGYKTQVKPIADNINFNLESKIMNLPTLEVVATRIKKFDWNSLIPIGIAVLIVVLVALSVRTK